MNSFDQQVKQWVDLDNKMKLMNEKMAELREQKNELNKRIFQHVQHNRLTEISLPISNGNGNSKLKFVTTNVAQPLTFKYVEKSLGEIIKNETQVKQIIDYLKQKREIKAVSEIKRIGAGSGSASTN